MILEYAVIAVIIAFLAGYVINSVASKYFATHGTPAVVAAIQKDMQTVETDAWHLAEEGIKSLASHSGDLADIAAANAKIAAANNSIAARNAQIAAFKASINSIQS